MKFILALFVLSIALTPTLAQQKANDALLLDLYQNQRYADAAIYLKSVYPEPVTDLKVLSRFAYTYQMAGKLPDALGYYQRMYQVDSTNVPVLFNLADISLKRDNNLKALGYFQKIVAIDSLNFMVYKQLGRLYAEKPDTINAVKSLLKANTLNPEDADVASELSLFMVHQKKNKEALSILNCALDADTANIFLLRTLMKLNYSMNKFAETVKICQKLLSLGDNSSDIYNKEGSSYFGLKNYECCIDAFARLPGVYQTERTFYLTAVSYRKLKDYPKAIEYYGYTLQQSISSNTDAYYYELADLYQTGHQLKKAIVNYQNSLFFDEKPMVFYTLANLYDTDLKDKHNAVKYYKKYLATNPPAAQKSYVEYVQSRIKALGK